MEIPDSDFRYYRIIQGEHGKDSLVDILYFNTKSQLWDVIRVKALETDKDFWIAAN